MTLRLVLAGPDGQREVAASVPPGTTVADLLRAEGLPTDGSSAWVDGRLVDLHDTVEQVAIPPGATLSTRPTDPVVAHPHPASACPTASDGPLRVCVVAGPGTGRSTRSRVGTTLTVGRDEDNDLVLTSNTASAHHLRVRFDRDAVEVVDLLSHNGTWTGGEAVAPGEPTLLTVPVTLRLGATVLRIDRPTGCEAPRGHDLGGKLRQVHRPPRPGPPLPVGLITPPAPVESPRAAPALRWAGILAPLALGGAMVAMTGSVRFALFALLSPVMALATWWSNRRRARRDGREASRTRRADLARFDDDLASARAAERIRREEAVPDLGLLVDRATDPSRRLWERRLHHDDALVVRWGSGDVTWGPRLVGSDGAPTGPSGPPPGGSRVEAVLHDLPVPLDLARHRIIGLVGVADVRRAVARSLVLQAAVLHGPADLVIEPVGAPTTWDWAKWLPHVSTRGGRRESRSPASQPGRRPARDRIHETAPARLLVIDEDGPGGRVLPDGVGVSGEDVDGGSAGTTTLAIVMADHADQLPATCTVVMEALADGTGRFLRDRDAGVDTLALAVADTATARHVARALARCVDPERASSSSTLPTAVPLADLVDDNDAGRPSADGLVVPIGRDRDGVVELDLVGDGPHALVAGTTGSGKSELLRTLVTGLALRHTTDDVVFVLVDYKGGSAFRTCADLPHTVGLVTDLDEALGERALRSLRAELRRRERVLAAAGVDDLPSHRAAGSPGEALPRLVVVIDEFATMASELPDFLDALVGVAQRGRSLGLHLVLATQRPRGCISADIRANTDLRIALRVHGEAEARDVLDDPRPAHLDPEIPGRAWIRRGQAEPREVQVAHASAPPTGTGAALVVTDFRLGVSSSDDPAGPAQDHLPILVERCLDRTAALGLPPPRRPWLPPLPDHVPLDDLRPDPTRGVLVGLADFPDQQSQRPVHWRPDQGHLAVVGRRGSGTTTTLVAVAAGLVAEAGPDDVHLHVVHDGTGPWKAARCLPHVGSVVDGHDHDDTVALFGWLLEEVDRRRRTTDLGDDARTARPPRIVVLVDGLAALLDVDDPRAGADIASRLGRVLDDGPSVDVAVAAATDRLTGTPARLRSAFSRRLVLDVDDRELAMMGISRDWSPAVPGRALDPGDLVELQVAEPPSWDRLTRPRPGPRNRPPHRITGLPDRSAIDDLPPPTSQNGLWLPIGTGRDAVPAVLHLHPGDHAVVAGPARSGRTSVLQVIASQVRRADPRVHQVAVCDEDRSTLHGWPSLDASGSPAVLDRVLAAVEQDADRRCLVLVDDVRRWGDLDRLGHIVRSCRRVTVVASGRPDELRGPFGGWLRALCTARTGVLLQPDLATGGDLLDVRLPRHVSTPLGPGRGFVVDAGSPSIAQLARPPAEPAPGGLASA
ncbi:FtsK/SpoIIIE domain-containing protein [Salsipaludibacter albus]|uniref:FtsK/SpoIIIE domain-containing protein n=1 Tax=Salsipaludibacter albus TaxID=2849650 RepID=UPI001EE47327|nr:FtsK/SpoIIIE domain-containing protein [Salsipaludibacter albus]MBY5163105.1 FHA domain-containing protein [Salsipaludibacter albus]